MAFCYLFLGATSYAQNQVRGDSSQLPEIDYSKQFNMKNFKSSNFSGFNRTYATKEIESKTLELPTYFGNLKPLPLTEWHSPKPDVYSKTLSLQDYQIKKAVDRWSNQLTLRTDEDLGNKNFLTKDKPYPTANIESKEVEAGKNVGGQQLKDLINRGVKPEQVKVGHGFNATQLGEGEGKENSNEPPKTSSQPK
jgi:hypothetical protein